MSTTQTRPGPALRGTMTALITPFNNEGIDWERLEAQIERQIEAGIDGLVPAGTTGECPTLSFEEHEQLIRFVVEKVDRRVAVVPGTGGNSTEESVRLSRVAKECGAHAGLVVVPYYNRPGPEGIVEHYRRIWEETELPIVVYNIPSRTGTALTTEIYDRLQSIPGCFAVKEASGDLTLASHLVHRGEMIPLAGDDALCIPMMSVGAGGVISVASNIVPMEMVAMTNAALVDNWPEARRIHRALFPLFRALFNETNPIPIKCAMEMLGHDSGTIRGPMTHANSHTESLVRGQLQVLGLMDEDLDAYIDPRD
ncbi:MAG: 4-hydroxy-tetrahydrodipicolinate synthase [Planctomycetota bacterium]